MERDLGKEGRGWEERIYGRYREEDEEDGEEEYLDLGLGWSLEFEFEVGCHFSGHVIVYIRSSTEWGLECGLERMTKGRRSRGCVCV